MKIDFDSLIEQEKAVARILIGYQFELSDVSEWFAQGPWFFWR